jgi:hypothetical protein
MPNRQVREHAGRRARPVFPSRSMKTDNELTPGRAAVMIVEHFLVVEDSHRYNAEILPRPLNVPP